MSAERTPFVTDAELKQQASAYTQPYATEIYRNLTRLSQRYEDEISRKDAAIEALRNPWISVKDRLPIKERWVIVVADGAMNCAWYDKKRGWHNGFNERPKNIRIEEITHWMPLPNPPQP